MAATWKRDYVKYQKEFLGIITLYKERTDLQAFTEILLSITTVILFSIFAIRPTARTIAQLIQENKGKEETIATMDEKIKNLALASDTYDRNKSKIDLLDTAVPTIPDPNGQQRQLEGVIMKDQIELVALSLGPASIVGNLSFAPLSATSQADQGSSALPLSAKSIYTSIDATGDYQKLLQFLGDIEKIRRPIFYDSFTFTTERQKSADGKPQLILSVAGFSPYYLDEVSTSSAAIPQ